MPAEDAGATLIEREFLTTLYQDNQELSKADLSTRLNASRQALEKFILKLKEIWDFSIPNKAGPDEIAAHIRKRHPSKSKDRCCLSY